MLCSGFTTFATFPSRKPILTLDRRLPAHPPPPRQLILPLNCCFPNMQLIAFAMSVKPLASGPLLSSLC